MRCPQRLAFKRKLTSVLTGLLLATAGLAASGAYVQPSALLRDPTGGDWRGLERYSGTLTRAQFEERLHAVFDPFNGLAPFLNVTDRAVTIFSSRRHVEPPLARIELASGAAEARALRTSFRPVSAFHRGLLARPLAGLRIAIEPADIGGSWGPMEDRSSVYRGYGRIQEGDLNLIVARILRARLKELGARVVLTRDGQQPVSGLSVSEVLPVVPAVLAQRSYILPVAFRSRTRNVRSSSQAYRRITAEVLLTKNLEALARAEKMRRAGNFDLTIVLQFDATPSSGHAGFAEINRNIFFVQGAYTARELTTDARQRWRLLTKLLQNVTPTETRVATRIAGCFRAVTGCPPVLYGNSPTTRAIAGSPYVVARNLAFNRDHDGPVVVTEPYFMNQPVTLQRLLAGDYHGRKLVAGKLRPSIYREYAGAVSEGVVEAYGSR